MSKFAFRGDGDERLSKWKHTLRVARSTHAEMSKDSRYHPKPSIRDSVHGAADAVEEYWQGN